MIRQLIPAAALCVATSLSAQQTAIRFGSLVDGTGRVLRDAVVVTNADTIVSVGTGSSAVPRGARVIDLRRYTGIPGMIDAHTHITYYWDGAPGSDPWRQGGQRRPQVTVFLAQENARRTLETGVTTIRDLGASDYSDLAIRDLINRGAMVGPRVFAAGYGLRRAPAQTQPNAPPGPPRGRLTSIDDVAAAVKAQVEAGADVIKVYGSTGSGADVTGRETLTYEEMKAIVDASRAAGKRVAIHSYGPEGGRDAVRAGATS
ncbi:MAG TPA: amidohydrolase family protein, partial [Gemmatimonadaceae bacterium]|nr:amidohydrolase family protein [Gemmatimonadaceae bacterium]